MLNDEINASLIISTEKNKARLTAELKANEELLQSIARPQSEIAIKAVEKWKSNVMMNLENNVSKIIKRKDSESNLKIMAWRWRKTKKRSFQNNIFKKRLRNEFWFFGISFWD